MDRQYNINFTHNSQPTQQAILALTAALNQLHAASNQARGSVQGIGAGSGSATGGVNALEQALLRVGGAAVVMRTVQGAIDALNAGLKESREYALQTAEANLKLRDSLQELANLRGKASADDQVTGETVGFMVDTGLTAAEAKDFRTQYGGAISASTDRFKTTGGKYGMSERTAAAFERQAAVFAERSGLDMDTGAKLSALLGEFGPVGSPEQGMNQLGVMAGLLNVKGVGDMKDLGRPFLSLIGEMVGSGDPEERGRFKSLNEAAATFSVATRRSGNALRATREVRQANRVLRKIAFSKDPAFQAIGITQDDDFITALEKLAPHVVGPQGDRFMQEHGLRNDPENQAARMLARDIKEIRQVLRDPAILAEGSQAVAKNRAYLDSTTGRNRRADARVFAADFLQGRKNEELVIARKNAIARLTQTGELHGAGQLGMDKLKDWAVKGGPLAGLMPDLGLPAGTDSRILEETYRDLERQAQDMGIDLKKEGLAMQGYAFRSPVAQQQLSAVARRVQEEAGRRKVTPRDSDAGIGLELRALARDPERRRRIEEARDPHPAAAADVRDAARRQTDLLRKIEENTRMGGVPEPIPGRAPALRPPVRPARP